MNEHDLEKFSDLGPPTSPRNPVLEKMMKDFWEANPEAQDFWKKLKELVDGGNKQAIREVVGRWNEGLPGGAGEMDSYVNGNIKIKVYKTTGGKPRFGFTFQQD